MSATMRSPVDDSLLLLLAQHVAQDVFPIQDILKDLGLSQAQFEEIKLQPTFSRYLQAAMLEWTGAQNTAGRIQVKAAAATELVLPDIFRAIRNVETPLGQRVDALRTLAKLGKLIDQPAEMALGATGPGFSITIQIGDTAKTFGGPAPTPRVIDHEPAPAVVEASPEWG